MTILIKPFLYLIAFGPLAVLFASVFGLACWLLMVCVRAIAKWPEIQDAIIDAMMRLEKALRPYLQAIQ
jgi:hypothetical protein